MERHDVLAMMTALKLAGMRAAYDDILADGLKRRHPVQQIIGTLLQTEVADKQARSIKYQMTSAKLPTAKELADFDFAASPWECDPDRPPVEEAGIDAPTLFERPSPANCTSPFVRPLHLGGTTLASTPHANVSQALYPVSAVRGKVQQSLPERGPCFSERSPGLC